jgi:hypothetical protein
MKRREWFRQMNCLVCGKIPSDPHHVRTRGAGGVDKDNIVPLCRFHHTELHTGGRHTFARKYGVNLNEKALEYEARYQAHEGGEPDLGF